jgi:hypothetical protein
MDVWELSPKGIGWFWFKASATWRGVSFRLKASMIGGGGRFRILIIHWHLLYNYGKAWKISFKEALLGSTSTGLLSISHRLAVGDFGQLLVTSPQYDI